MSRVYPSAGHRANQWAVGVTTIACAAVLVDAPFVRGGINWQWALEPRPLHVWDWLVLAALAMLLFAVRVAVVKAGTAITARPILATLAVIFLLGCCLQVGLLSLYDGPVSHHLVRKVASPQFTSYFTVAVENEASKSWPGFLRRYPELVSEFPLHAQTHPPGLILFCSGVNRLCERLPALTAFLNSRLGAVELDERTKPLAPHQLAGALLVGLFTIGVTSLTVLPLFGLARECFSARTALRLSLWYVLIPSVALMVPEFDGSYIFLTLSMLFVASASIRRDSLLCAAAAGLLCAFGVFLTFGLGVLVGLLVLYFALETLRRDGQLPWPSQIAKITRLTATACLAAVLPYLCLNLVYGFDLLETFRACMAPHVATQHSRSYLVGLFLAPYDVLFFFGFPLTVYWLFAARQEGGLLSRRDSAGVNPFQVLAIVALTGLTLSGQTRGETARLWMFVMGIATLGIGRFLENNWDEDPSYSSPADALLFVQCVLLRAMWRVP